MTMFLFILNSCLVKKIKKFFLSESYKKIGISYMLMGEKQDKKPN